MIRLPRGLLSFGVSVTVYHGFYLSFCKLSFTLLEFMYLVFTRMPGESCRRRLGSLLLYLCDVLRAVITPLCVDFVLLWYSLWGWLGFRINSTTSAWHILGCPKLSTQNTKTTLRQHSAPQLRSVLQCKLFLGEILGKRPLSQFACTSVLK